MARFQRAGLALTLGLLVVLGTACGDDSGPARDGLSGEQGLDGSSGEGGSGLTIKSLKPDKATLILKQLQDVYVTLSKPAPTETYVDITSKDPLTISVVHQTLKFDVFDSEKMTTVEALKLTSGQDVGVEFKIRGTGATATFYAKVQKTLPDAGPLPD